MITGASDDDPSGIATYSQAGAQFGYALGWTLLLTYPLMCAIQMVSAQIGRVTGRGLAGNMRRYYPAPLLYLLVGLLIVANTINIGADLGAMAAALRLVETDGSRAHLVRSTAAQVQIRVSESNEPPARKVTYPAVGRTLPADESWRCALIAVHEPGDRSPMEKLRILCLHGYHGSAQVLRRQMAPLADGLDGLAEFVYIDAPSLAAGDFGWWHAVVVESSAARSDPGVAPRVKRYNGWQRSCDAIVSAFVRQGPFDAVLGFSQGAALAAVLVGLRSRVGPAGSGPTGPASGLSGPVESLNFDFAVMIGGFVAADVDLARLYGADFDLPSAHIIGRSDAVVPREASIAQASKFRNPLIMEHEGGHVVSNAPQVRQGVRAFFEQKRQRK